MADYWTQEKGKVQALGDEDPPTSSLVEVFSDLGEPAADAIVLRGYLGRSNIIKRTLAYLERAKRIEAEKAKTEVLTALAGYAAEAEHKAGEGVENLQARLAEVPAGGASDIDDLIERIKVLDVDGVKHIPWRLYLTPSLDRYVDFHRSSLLAYRREPSSERQDTVTVWLRAFEQEGRLPIPYRVVQETNIGPSSSAYLGGDLVDDYLGQPGTQGTAWGNQAGPYAKYTTPRCGE